MTHLDTLNMGSRYPWLRYGDHVVAEIDKGVHTLPVPHTVEGGAAACPEGGSCRVSCSSCQGAPSAGSTVESCRDRTHTSAPASLFLSICMAVVAFQVTESDWNRPTQAKPG
jgi:hypothetical protein